MHDNGVRYRIRQIARRTALPVKTVGFDADLGLVPPAGRSAAGYRSFDVEPVARLEIVRSLRELGFDLAAVRRLLEGQAGTCGPQPCDRCRHRATGSGEPGSRHPARSDKGLSCACMAWWPPCCRRARWQLFPCSAPTGWRAGTDSRVPLDQPCLGSRRTRAGGRSTAGPSAAPPTPRTRDSACDRCPRRQWRHPRPALPRGWAATPAQEPPWSVGCRGIPVLGRPGTTGDVPGPPARHVPAPTNPMDLHRGRTT